MDEQKVGEGGGVDDEMIEIVEMSIEEIKARMVKGSSHISPPNSMLGILWFLFNKAPNFI